MTKTKLPSMKEKQPEPVPQVTQLTVQVVTVDVPYLNAEGNGGYESRRCDLGSLTGEQARKLNAIRRGYDYHETKLQNGGEVKSLADAVKALIESVNI